jgi:two-component system chemotaxis sensor kinase CheA
MDVSDFIDIFIDEGRKQLIELESSVLKFEQGDRSAETLQSIIWTTHSLKGSSLMMGFMGTGDLTRAMENVLYGLRNGEIEFTAAITSALSECIPVLAAQLDVIAVTGSESDMLDQDVALLVERLNLGIPKSVPGTSPAASDSYRMSA